MSIELIVPDNPVILHKAKVAAFKVEDNVEHWIEVWVVVGEVNDEGVFQEWHDPITGATRPALYYKLEMGVHPMRPGQSLRRCPSCGAWHGLELVCGCGSPTAPYDGFARACFIETPYNNPRNVLRYALYSFLTSEEVPHPDTGEMVKLVNATWEG
jgi:hypothetical protein